VDRYDVAIFVGLALLVFAVTWLAGWPGLVGLVGGVVVALGLAGALDKGHRRH
jgi:hypothetical protein